MRRGVLTLEVFPQTGLLEPLDAIKKGGDYKIK